MVLVNSFFVRADSEPRGVVSKPDTISFTLLQLATIPPFHFSTALSGHSTYIYGGMVLICITLSGVGLPGVNLIIYKDDLRMMAPIPVAAKEGHPHEVGNQL